MCVCVCVDPVASCECLGGMGFAAGQCISPPPPHSPPPPPPPPSPRPPPSTWVDARLAGSEGSLNPQGTGVHYSGRLEIRRNGQWGTVCDDAFNDNSAKVACRQMGYPFAYAKAAGSAAYGRGWGESGERAWRRRCQLGAAPPLVKEQADLLRPEEFSYDGSFLPFPP